MSKTFHLNVPFPVASRMGYHTRVTIRIPSTTTNSSRCRSSVRINSIFIVCFWLRRGRRGCRCGWDWSTVSKYVWNKLIISLQMYNWWGNLPMCRTNVPESRIILFPDIRHLFWSQATGSTATKNHGELGNQDNSQKYDWFCHDLKAYYA